MPEKEPGKSRGRPQSTTPEEYPVTSSQSVYPSGDYSYTVEIVATIQHQLGKLTEAVESLKEQAKTHGRKLEEIGKDVHAAKIVIAVVGTLVAGAAAFLGFAIKLYVDYIRISPK